MPAFQERHAEHKEAGKLYTNSFTCVTGHNMQSDSTSDHVLPHWPKEVHYYGRGHGSYPFWVGPNGADSSSNIEVWWSETRASEKFYHANCHLEEAGYKEGACYHLFVGSQPSPKAYLYSADEKFCCVSSPTGRRAEQLTAPQSDWMDQMTYQGTKTKDFDFYSGEAKYYTMTLPFSEPVTFFWFYTTMDGRPLEQGEGGIGKGLKVWHDYNYTSFKSTILDPEVFAVPSICQSTTDTCAFP